MNNFEMKNTSETKAFSYFKKAAEEGNVKAMFEVGLRLAQGRGVAQNHQEAVKWYTKAAKKGNADALFCLGICYAEGYGVEKDDVKAVQCYRKAADLGNADAMYCLGLCYNNNLGVEKNIAEAIYWYKRAAEKGNADALYMLGWCYSEFEISQEDIESNRLEYIKQKEKAKQKYFQDMTENLNFIREQMEIYSEKGNNPKYLRTIFTEIRRGLENAMVAELSLRGKSENTVTKITLEKRIQLFSKFSLFDDDMIKKLYDIKNYANMAAHYNNVVFEYDKAQEYYSILLFLKDDIEKIQLPEA